MRAVAEIDWEAMNDARILADAQTIMSDKERYANAVRAAVVLAADDEQKSNAMKKVAGQKVKNNLEVGLNETLQATIASL